jgi:hypothetical protein
MVPFPISMPGAWRLRTVQPLIDEDGTCSLVFDVERRAVFDVPEELRLHVAPALETGDLDEDLLAWLSSEDLLTAEGWGDWSGWGGGGSDGMGGAGVAGAALDIPERFVHAAPPSLAALPQLSPASGPGYAGEEVHGWIGDAAEDAALDALDTLFKRAFGAPRVKLHLDWAGTLPPRPTAAAGGLLERIVAEARRRAAPARQEIGFELALDPHEVRPEAARRLAALGVHVRLRCGECDPVAQLGTPHENRPWLLAAPAVKLLLDALACSPLAAAERSPMLTVQCVLHGPSRLIELWRWAKAMGVRSLDAIRLEESSRFHPAGGAGLAPLATRAREAREYRLDLEAICDETCSELEAGRLPVEFQPFTRIIRRMLRGEPQTGGVFAELSSGLAPGGGLGGRATSLTASFRRLIEITSLDPRQLPEQWWSRLGAGTTLPASPLADGVPGGALRPAAPEAEAESTGFACLSCWARQVCSHSAYVASPVGSEDPRAPSRQRCAIWCAEVEMALRLFHRLAQADPIHSTQVQRFLDGEPAAGGAHPFHPAHPLHAPAAQPFDYLGLLGTKPS